MGQAPPRVFVTAPLPGEAADGRSVLDPLRDVSTCRVFDREGRPSPEELCRLAGACEGLLCLLTDRVDLHLMDACPSLRVISSCSVGVDHIDVEAATARGIRVGNTPGVLTDATADLAFGLLLAAARRLPEADRFVRDHRWDPDRCWEPAMMLGADLSGATLGLIGLGPIGRAVARRAQGFGMRVVGWTRSQRRVEGVLPSSLENLLEVSDFVSVHVPLAQETRNLLDGAALARMKPGAILINTSRGGIVDEHALARALSRGALRAAALDVFGQEPLERDSPLRGLENVVLAPHIGSATSRTREAMARLAVDNLIAGLAGEPLRATVNPEIANRR